MPLTYFAKHTHHEVHVQTHRQWLGSKNSCELPDWPDVGEQDCLFGAVLRAMDHCKLAVTGNLADDPSDVLNVAALRNEAVAGAQAIYDDESHRFHAEFDRVLQEHVWPEKEAHATATGQVYANAFEYWKDEMKEGV